MAKVDLKSLSLSELKALKTRVEKAIERHDKKEKAKAVQTLKATAKSLGFSLEELVGGEKKTSVAKPKKAKAAAKAMYRHPDDTSLTWGGRGPRPKWLRDALNKGKSLEDFKV